ncbi:MAG: YdjY domain-containing protein [Verrucomicrobiota bacterium]
MVWPAVARKDDCLLGLFETAAPVDGSDRGTLARHPTDPSKLRWTLDNGSYWEVTPDLERGILEAEGPPPDITIRTPATGSESATLSLVIEGQVFVRKSPPLSTKPTELEESLDHRPRSSVPNRVIRIDEGHFQVGNILLQKKTREISFDARVNQTAGAIEFLLVHGKGKIHESVFACDISPTDLNIAFKLLGYPSSPELFEIRTPDFKPTGSFPKVPNDVSSRARIGIKVTWREDAEEKTVDANELVTNSRTGGVVPPGPWLYTGSLITKSGFRAETTGDIIAIYTTASAMVNYPGQSRIHDDIWSVTPDRLPARDTPVRITIGPFARPALPEEGKDQNTP